MGSAALSLNGDGDYMDVTPDAFPNNLVGFYSGSVAFWVKLALGAEPTNIQILGNLNAGDTTAILAGTNGVGGIQIFPRAANGNQLRVRDGGEGDVFNPNLSWADGDWHHLAYTWEVGEAGSETVGLYIDGAPLELSFAADSLTSDDPVSPWEFGMTVGGRNNRGNVDMFLNVSLDDFRVYLGPLSEQQVADLASMTSSLSLDFNGDGALDAADADLLVDGIIVAENNPTFDLNVDGLVDNSDLSDFLAGAAAENGFGMPYLRGDANLDSSVGAADLNALGLQWRQDAALWSGGDFDANGTTDAADLNALGVNWLRSVEPAGQAVPEPTMTLQLVLLALGCLGCGRRRHHPGANTWF